MALNLRDMEFELSPVFQGIETILWRSISSNLALFELSPVFQGIETFNLIDSAPRW